MLNEESDFSVWVKRVAPCRSDYSPHHRQVFATSVSHHCQITLNRARYMIATLLKLPFTISIWSYADDEPLLFQSLDTTSYGAHTYSQMFSELNSCNGGGRMRVMSGSSSAWGGSSGGRNLGGSAFLLSVCAVDGCEVEVDLVPVLREMEGRLFMAVFRKVVS